MAGATSRVRLGAAGQNPLLTHPVEIAAQVATLDLLSGGRAYVGLARGAWLDGLGVDTARPLARLNDAVAIIRAVLAGDDGGYDGELLSLPPGLRLAFKLPGREVDLLVGTWGRQTARWAARVGAAEVKIGGCANPDMVALMASWLAEASGGTGTHAAEEGDGLPPGVPAVVAGAVTVCDEDGAAARALARREVALYLDVVAELDPTLTLPPDVLPVLRAALARGDHEAAGRAIPDDILDRFAFAGTPERIAAQVETLFAAGASRVEFGTPHGLDPLRGVELLGERVLPAVRR